MREESRARRLLEAHGLPRLSLFHLEAGGAGRDERRPRLARATGSS